MPKNELELLLFLASGPRQFGETRTSTAKIARHFGISQQTASRKLRQLSRQGLIELDASPKGCIVSLTKPGLELLGQAFISLQQIFEEKRKKPLFGTVKTGLGEGRYYVSRPPYLEQFKKKLDFKPYPGTLNLLTEEAELSAFLFGISPIEIKGFETKERSFGKIKAFKVKVEGKHLGALIFPERTAHKKNEIEIISKTNLRKKLKLKEGSKVRISIA